MATKRNADTMMVQTEDGEVEVSRSVFSADDYAKALASAKETHKRNKRDSYVLRCFEERVAELAYARMKG